MNPKYIIDELERNKEVFQFLLQDIPSSTYLWKQDPKKWCLLEMLCHLVDEEKEDFRARVQHVLSTPDKPAKPIAPQEWVSERNYIDQNYNEVLVKFKTEREASIVWLNTLKNPVWENVYHHPKLGGLTAKMFLTNWLAHDYLHIRQIIKLKYDYLSFSYNEKLSYAGEW
jgi:DinB family protein